MLLCEDVLVWPGDVPFSIDSAVHDGFFSSSVAMSLHAGTHIDAPRHRYPAGRTVDDIAPLIVPVLVNIHGSSEGKAVFFDGPLTVLQAEQLVKAGVVLVGTASTSIDCEGVTGAHDAILGADIPVIENLKLEAVPPGEYIALVFPLRIKGADASPVRVLLAENTEDVFSGACSQTPER